MEDWKKYKIVERKEYPKGSSYEAYVRFILDDWVEYSDKNEKFVVCSNTAYFHSWAEGDELKISTDKIKQFKSSTTFLFDDSVAIECYVVIKVSSRLENELRTKYEEEKEKREELDKGHQKCLPIRQWLEFENKELKEEVKSLKQQIEQLQQTQISIPPKESN